MTDSDSYFTLTANIKALFRAHPGSAADYARKYNVSESTVSKWCSGQFKKIDFRDVIEIAEYFDIPIEQMTAKPVAGTAYSQNRKQC